MIITKTTSKPMFIVDFYPLQARGCPQVPAVMALARCTNRFCTYSTYLFISFAGLLLGRRAL